MLVAAVILNVILTSSTNVITLPNIDIAQACSDPAYKVINVEIASAGELFFPRADSDLAKIKSIISGRGYVETETSVECPQSDDYSHSLDDPSKNFIFFFHYEDSNPREVRQDAGNFITTKCSLIYFDTITIESPKMAQTPLKFNSHIVDPYCNVILSFSFATPKAPLISVTLNFSLVKQRATWSANNVLVTVDKEKDTAVAEDLSSSNGLAYFCPTLSLVGAKYTIELKHFEIQAETNGDVFFKPRDCRGFVSIPILMGYCVFILLSFFTVMAVWMLSSMHSIERFDDPKKPTFYIPSQEI